MKIAIWKRYILKHFLKMFCLFLCCFYGLFVIIDYSTHTNSFTSSSSIEWSHLIVYYLFVFASRSDILIPLAILIASIYTTYTLNSRMELIALRASGFSLFTLMRPFILCGLLGTLFMFANEEFILPHALPYLKKIESQTKHQRKNQHRSVSVNSLVLEDGSLFFYQSYDDQEKRFFDTYWIESIDSVYRMKYLMPHTQESNTPIGYFVDHLTRNTLGELEQEKEHRELPLPQIKFGKEKLQSTLIDPDCLSISDLCHQVKQLNFNEMNDKESHMITSLYSKCTIPWLSLFAALAPAPFCARFSRQHPFFLIILCSLFGLIAFYLFLDAAAVISRRQLVSPAIAIAGSFLAISGPFFIRFLRINKI